MTQSFDSGRFAGLPADVRALFEAQRAMLEADGSAQIASASEPITSLQRAFT